MKWTKDHMCMRSLPTWRAKGWEFHFYCELFPLYNYHSLKCFRLYYHTIFSRNFSCYFQMWNSRMHYVVSFCFFFIILLLEKGVKHHKLNVIAKSLLYTFIEYAHIFLPGSLLCKIMLSLSCLFINSCYYAWRQKPTSYGLVNHYWSLLFN